MIVGTLHLSLFFLDEGQVSVDLGLLEKASIH